MDKKISIVVPVYNNEGTLFSLFKEVQELEIILLKKNIILELIFVDDGSKDRSWEVIQKIRSQRPSTKIAKLSRNFGANKCVKAGLQYVTGDAFTALAADLQDPPALIAEMVDLWQEGHRFVVCERKTRKDPLLSRMLSGAFYKILRKIVFPNYPAGGFDMLLADKKLIPYLKNSSQSASLPILAFWLGFKPEIIPYDRQERASGKSGWTFLRKFNYFLDIILSYSIFPLRAMSFIGLLVALLSFGYGAFIIISAVLGQISVQGFATLVVLITFFQGLIILMLGVVGEYLWRMSLELNKRPEAIVEECQIFEDDS